MRLTKLRSFVATAATVALSGAGLVAFGAFTATPTAAATAGVVTYEADCTGPLLPNTTPVAPIIVGTAGLNASPDPSIPVGGKFGASGNVSLILPGAVLAGLMDQLNPSEVGGALTETISSTDGTATGSFGFTNSGTGPFALAAVPAGDRQLTGVSWDGTTATLLGNFQNSDIGGFVSSTTNGLPSGAVILSVVAGTSALLSSPTTSAGSAATIGIGQNLVLVSPVSIPATTFTTSGSNGHTADIGVTSVSGAALLTNTVSIQLGSLGGSGFGCTETGYDGATPGPGQAPAPGPLLPAGSTSPLVNTSPLTFATAADVGLVDTPPTPTDATLSINVSSSGNFNLTAAQNSYPVDQAGFTLVSASQGATTVAAAGGTVTVGNITFTQNSAGSAQVNYVDTDTNVTSYSLTFQACDTLAAGNGGPVCSTSPGTIQVVVAPPTLQPLSENVVPGSLQVSCDAPAVYVSTPPPLATCTPFPFTSITLNGLEQQVSATTGNTNGSPSTSNPGTIYISDNRGNPLVGWNFSSFFVKSGAANTNPNCANVVAFCDENPGDSTNASNLATVLNSNGHGSFNGQIAPNYLAVSNIQCQADSLGGPGGYNPPNLNPNATPTTGFEFSANPQSLCSAAVGDSGGTFLYNATYTLTIPESVYAGNYLGTVQYLAS